MFITLFLISKTRRSRNNKDFRFLTSIDSKFNLITPMNKSIYITRNYQYVLAVHQAVLVIDVAIINIQILLSYCKFIVELQILAIKIVC